MTNNKSIAEVEASKEIYAIARQEADIEITRLKEEIQASKEEGYCVGAIRANKAHRDYSNFLDAVVLYKMKKSKDYKKAGLTWEKFCEEAGYPRRSAEDIIEQVTPIFEAFSANLPVLAGVNLSDIRWLGKNINGESAGLSDDGKFLVIGDDKIRAFPEDITAYIKNLQETHAQEREDLKASIRAKEKVLTSKEKVMNDQEREIARLKRTVPKSELTEEEQDAVNLLVRVQTDFLAAISDIKKKIKPQEAPEIALRQYYYLLVYMQKITADERIALHEYFEPAEMGPDEITEEELPSTDVLVDNLPNMAGKGIGKKVVEKLEERQAKKGKK